MNKYYKNSVLCGEIDYYCLLCEETFKDQADVERHIRWENHRKKLKNNTYLPKFKGNFIVKLGTLYYCEVCNIVMPTALKTSLHIADPKHIQRKQNPDANSPQSPPIVKRDAGAIKVSNIVLNEKQWNGIIDSQCILCDMDLDDMDGHMKTASHVIALIQTKTECADEVKFYRKIGSDIFFCFTCKQPLAKAFFDDHWTSKEHLDSKNKSSNNGASSSNFTAEFKNNLKKMFASPAAGQSSSDQSPDIADKLEEFQNENIDINFERSKATCKTCNFTPAFTVKAITEHIKMHKKAENFSPGFVAAAQLDEESDDDDEAWETDSADSLSEPITDDEKENLIFMANIDHGQLRAELARFGKPHFIKLARGGSKGYCALCDSYISAHIKNFKQHVKGAKHLGHIELKNAQNATNTNDNAQKEYQTKSLKNYLRNIFFVKQMDDFWINRKLCVDKHSFTLLCHLECNGKYDKIKCFLCDETFPSDKDQAHCEKVEHKNKLFDTKVLISLKGEFVREVRANLFHCGFCNEVCPSWLTMKRHLKTLRHLERRSQQQMVADMTDDMYSMSMDDTNTADADIMWMQLMGHRLF